MKNVSSLSLRLVGIGLFAFHFSCVPLYAPPAGLVSSAKGDLIKSECEIQAERYMEVAKANLRFGKYAGMAYDCEDFTAAAEAAMPGISTDVIACKNAVTGKDGGAHALNRGECKDANGVSRICLYEAQTGYAKVCWNKSDGPNVPEKYGDSLCNPGNVLTYQVNHPPGTNLNSDPAPVSCANDTAGSSYQSCLDCCTEALLKDDEGAVQRPESNLNWANQCKYFCWDPERAGNPVGKPMLPLWNGLKPAPTPPPVAPVNPMPAPAAPVVAPVMAPAVTVPPAPVMPVTAPTVNPLPAPRPPPPPPTVTPIPAPPSGYLPQAYPQ